MNHDIVRVLVHNNVSVKGLNLFPELKYSIALDDVPNPHIILLRSKQLKPDEIPDSVVAVARAGAGVNNIPVAELTPRGIPVFNTPGANSNAVKELLFCGLLLASRNVIPAMQFIWSATAAVDYEAVKKEFAGFELKGSRLGIFALGAIGGLVAQTARDFGMELKGFDPFLTVQQAQRLPREVEIVEDDKLVLTWADFVTLHLPLNDQTRGSFGVREIELMKRGAFLANFARGELVDEDALLAALDADHLGGYITDFPSPALLRNPKVLALPHLGASTEQAEENCAVMAVEQVRDFVENGTIRNSVNYPNISLEREAPYRILVLHDNVPGMLGEISDLMAASGYNIAEAINKCLQGNS